MYPKLKINVYFIFLNIGDLTFGITLVYIPMVSLNNPPCPQVQISVHRLAILDKVSWFSSIVPLPQTLPSSSLLIHYSQIP
jgi:hypothetical protein